MRCMTHCEENNRNGKFRIVISIFNHAQLAASIKAKYLVIDECQLELSINYKFQVGNFYHLSGFALIKKKQYIQTTGHVTFDKLANDNARLIPQPESKFVHISF